MQKHGAWVLNEKHVKKYIGVATVTVDKIAEQSSTPDADGTNHHIVFVCTPKKMGSGALIMNSDGEVVELKKGVPVKLSLSFSETMKGSKPK